ncbi:MATE family efflux transporter [Haladaptatus sp. CMAA 1911]|uniref:MATE family efflux transporter n=1 Tax=unclassified Haladaptatus TaxID=2622732 RepID=UPI003754C004
MLNVSGEEITTGSLKKSLAFIAIPIVAQQLALSAQQIIDVFWLGRFDATAVAAVGLVAPIVGLVATIVGAVFGGIQIIVSQRIGANNRTGASRIAVHGLLVAVTLMSGVSLFMYTFASDITQLFNTTPAVAHLAAIYLSASTLAYTVSAMSDSLEAAFLGSGDSRIPLIVNLVAIGTNAVLDPFLIIGWKPFPKYGIAGAAYATLIGYAVGGNIVLTLALSGRGKFTITRTALQFELDEIVELIRVGGPKIGRGVGQQTARLLIVTIITITGGSAALTATLLVHVSRFSCSFQQSELGQRRRRLLDRTSVPIIRTVQDKQRG